jgi:hypothetical protein
VLSCTNPKALQHIRDGLDDKMTDWMPCKWLARPPHPFDRTLGGPERCNRSSASRASRRTPRRFRTRVITEGVTPSPQVDYKRSRIKQNHKEGRAVRTETTETTINDTRGFGVGRLLKNLPELRLIFAFHPIRMRAQFLCPPRPTLTHREKSRASRSMEIRKLRSGSSERETVALHWLWFRALQPATRVSELK